jgi:hypothetical protein
MGRNRRRRRAQRGEKNHKKEMMMWVGGETAGIEGVIWNGCVRNCPGKVDVHASKRALYTRPEGLDGEPSHKKSYEGDILFPLRG